MLEELAARGSQAATPTGLGCFWFFARTVGRVQGSTVSLAAVTDVRKSEFILFTKPFLASTQQDNWCCR